MCVCTEKSNETINSSVALYLTELNPFSCHTITEKQKQNKTKKKKNKKGRDLGGEKEREIITAPRTTERETGRETERNITTAPHTSIVLDHSPPPPPHSPPCLRRPRRADTINKTSRADGAPPPPSDQPCPHACCPGPCSVRAARIWQPRRVNPASFDSDTSPDTSRLSASRGRHRIKRGIKSGWGPAGSISRLYCAACGPVCSPRASYLQGGKWVRRLLLRPCALGRCAAFTPV